MKNAMVLLFAIAAGVGAFALLARAGSEPAQAVEPTPEIGPAVLETFVALDHVDVRRNQVRLRGLLLGGSDVVERAYTAGFSDSTDAQGLLQRCERLALLMLTKPGAYQLDMDPFGGPDNSMTCTLRRNE